MSNFACEKCGGLSHDTPTGYISGCAHYPPEEAGIYSLDLGGGESADAEWDRSQWTDENGAVIEPELINSWECKR